MSTENGFELAVRKELFLAVRRDVMLALIASDRENSEGMEAFIGDADKMVRYIIEGKKEQ